MVTGPAPTTTPSEGLIHDEAQLDIEAWISAEKREAPRLGQDAGMPSLPQARSSASYDDRSIFSDVAEER